MDISFLIVFSTIRLLLTSIIEPVLPCSEIELTITILPILRNNNLILYSQTKNLTIIYKSNVVVSEKMSPRLSYPR